MELIPKDETCIIAFHINKGTSVDQVNDVYTTIREDLSSKGVNLDNCTFVPVGPTMCANKIEIIPENRYMASWIEYPRAHYFKCSECKYTVPYSKAMPINGFCVYKYCPSCGKRIKGWKTKGDK